MYRIQAYRRTSTAYQFVLIVKEVPAGIRWCAVGDRLIITQARRPCAPWRLFVAGHHMDAGMRASVRLSDVWTWREMSYLEPVDVGRHSTIAGQGTPPRERASPP